MAESSPSPAPQDPIPADSSVTETPNSPLNNPQSNLDPDPDPDPPSQSQSLPPPNPNPNPNPTTPPSINQFAQPSPVAPPILPPAVPSFRPLQPQFTPVGVNPQYQMQGAPPGVAMQPPPSVMPMMPGGGVYQMQQGQVQSPLGVRPPYGVMGNPYMGQVGGPPGSVPMPMHPPGMVRYPYQAIVRPPFPSRPPGPFPMVPPQPRPMITGFRPQMFPAVVRPPITPIVIEEKPHTKAYVGKIATVENEFVLPLLKLCGPVKDWKRAQDPTTGALKGFGFCEFESAEGVLRALRLLNKLNVDGQELMLNIDKATREYLERYVEKKRETEVKSKESQTDDSKKDGESAVDAEKGPATDEEKGPSVLMNGTSQPPEQEAKKDENQSEKDNDMANFGLVTDEDRETDEQIREKIANLIEERLRTKPLPPPPPLPPRNEGTTNSNFDDSANSGDRESDADTMKKDEKNDGETTSDTRAPSRAGTESPDRGGRYDNISRERDRDRDLKREKEMELERMERERERDRARRERTRELQVQRAEKEYERRVREWEAREKEKEKERRREKEREKERERERRRLIADEEDESDDDSRKRRRRSEIEDKRKKRRREKEDDLEGRLKEEEEIVEAKKRDEEQRQRQLEEAQKQQVSALAAAAARRSPSSEVVFEEIKEKDAEKTHLIDASHRIHIGDVAENGGNDDSIATSSAAHDAKSIGNLQNRKLGFGLVGLGKRATVLSVFDEEEDETQKEKKMRPLVPIDYSMEELQAVHTGADGSTPPGVPTAAEITKPKEDRVDGERERSRRSHDRSSHRERNDGDNHRPKNETREQSSDHSRDRERGSKNADSKKVLDAKQLIDMIPRTKDELFSYDINWTVYDRHNIHEVLRPWISKKIVEFLGEEENTLVDYIVSSTQKHVGAPEMLELLESILDEEAEMFVLKMWRMLIFEIKKVETGLAARPRA